MDKFNLLHIYEIDGDIRSQIIMPEDGVKACQVLRQELVKMLRMIENNDEVYKVEYIKDKGVAITNENRTYIDALIICDKCIVPESADEMHELLAKTFDIFRDPVNVYINVVDDVDMVDEENK